MSMVEFGGSLTHFVLHIGTNLQDIAMRRDTHAYGVQGFKDDHKTMKQVVHDEIYTLLSLRVGEARAGGAGTSE